MTRAQALLAKLRSALARPRGDVAHRGAIFRFRYERFREILARNERTLELIADIEERLAAPAPFSLSAVARRIRAATMDVFVMAKDLNQIEPGRWDELYQSLSGIVAEIDALLAQPQAEAGVSTVPIAALRATDAAVAGIKLANLGEVGALGFAVPPGFAIPTGAALAFLDGEGLWERCDRLEEILELHGHAALVAACAEVRAAVVEADLPAALRQEIERSVAACFAPGDRLAVRSSALGEDAAGATHAGLYRSLLGVRPDGVVEAYREVVASAFSPAAVCYRYERGLTASDVLMAVGVMAMVDAHRAGILYSRPPAEAAADVVVVTAVAGLGTALAGGEVGGESLAVVPGAESEVASSLLDAGDLRALTSAGRALERHFGCVQDVEWAIDGKRRLVILQARPLAASAHHDPEPVAEGERPILAGGFVACPGVASGPVFAVRDPADLVAFPAGAILVARHSAPEFAQVMSRAAAIVTDVGSPTGHMASLAREYGVPAVVGLAGASALTPGTVVTVDADHARVLAGARLEPRRREAGRPSGSASHAALERLARHVTPLRLTDPTARDFRPECCRSLHDVTRFVHEKAYEVMFHFGEVADSGSHAVALRARLPIEVRVFDVGGGVAPEAAGSGPITPGDVASVPMRAFLDGLLEPGIRWDMPRPVSVRGFLAVVGASVAAPPAEARRVGRLSYAIVSDRYLNFSTKAGYHFSTVDTYCSEGQQKNYLHFRFAGGGADPDRRARRVRFLAEVLAALDFSVSVRGDLLTARFDKFPADLTLQRTTALGRLTLCARQLDMLMDSDRRAAMFARAFLDGRWDVF